MKIFKHLFFSCILFPFITVKDFNLNDIKQDFVMIKNTNLTKLLRLNLVDQP